MFTKLRSMFSLNSRKQQAKKHRRYLENQIRFAEGIADGLDAVLFKGDYLDPDKSFYQSQYRYMCNTVRHCDYIDTEVKDDIIAYIESKLGGNHTLLNHLASQELTLDGKITVIRLDHFERYITCCNWFRARIRELREAIALMRAEIYVMSLKPIYR